MTIEDLIVAYFQYNQGLRRRDRVSIFTVADRLKDEGQQVPEDKVWEAHCHIQRAAIKLLEIQG